MKNLLNLNFSPKEAGSAARGADFLSLTVKKGDKETSASFSAELDFPLSDEIFFDYSILGLYRGLAYRTPLIYLTSDEGEVTPLIAYDDLNTDGGRYKVSAKVPKGEYTHINIDIAVDRAKVCELKIFKLYTACACEMPAALSHFERSPLSSVYPIDISNLFDARYDFDKNEIKIGGGKAFEKTSITPHGIPFSVKIEGVNAASFPAPPKENDEIIENFGVRAKRGVCRPVTRNSALSVKIDKCASEIYFILGMDGERYQRYTFATKGNILGTYGREVTKPLFVDDVEGFYVEIIYSSGKKDISFPKNITENRFSVSGDVSVYAVGTDYEEISSVVFHNKKLTTEFSLLAVSVNEAPVGYFPDLEIPKQAHYPERIASKDSYVKCEGDRLTIKNGAISLGADVSEHLALSYLESDYAKSLKCCTGSLIRLVCESGEELSFPRVTSVSLDESTAAVNLVGEGLEFTVKFDISENDRVLLSLSVKNCGSEEKRVGIIFPAIDTVEGESSDDLYYFVPKYQNINSNETIVVHEESSPSFPMQFLSVYSKSEGAGLGLLTRERETKVRIYHLEKRENKASLGVEYPAMYTKIAAGGEFFATDAVLEAADGDWHKTFDSYREWLASWYVPYKCQNKQWYRECFWLLAEITDFFETYEMVKFPIWHELGKPKFNFLNILEEQKKISGAYPDILHMWHW
ncbi:MAG: hypothetical protein J6Q68_03765, partial [Clostridia bacterium]|nr:hypothetical protein [Clostridia bacterium]